MLGLIKKDLFMIKSNLRLLVILLFAFTVISFNDNNSLYFMISFLSLLLFMSTFSYDEYNKWDSYAIVFPVFRKDIVKSKYIATFVVVFFSFIVTFVLSVFMGYVNNNLDFSKILSTLFGCAMAIFLIISIMYPFIFKYGIEKARLVIFAGVFGVSSILGLFFSNINIEFSQSFLLFMNDYGYFFLFVVVVLLFFLSYQISKRIYVNKNF